MADVPPRDFGDPVFPDPTGPTLAQEVFLTYSNVTGSIILSIVNQNELGNYFEYKLSTEAVWNSAGQTYTILPGLHGGSGNLIVDVRGTVTNPGAVSITRTANLQAEDTVSGILSTSELIIKINGA